MPASGDRTDSSQSEQVGFTDFSDSGSDIDIYGLIDHSDQNSSSNSHAFDYQVHKADKDQAPQPSGSNHISIDQNHINSKILEQLSALGARLDSMKNSMKTVKKTNNSTKIKRSKARTKATVVQTGLQGVGAAPPNNS